MIETRLLDPSNPSDVQQLDEILDHWCNDLTNRPNQIWSDEAGVLSLIRIKKHFTENNKNHILIGGLFNSGILEDIYVGEKLAIYLNDSSNPDKWPYWITSLVYSKSKSLADPHKKLFQIGVHVIRRMEKLNYYSFLNFLKLPIKVNTDDLVKRLDYNLPFSALPSYHSFVEAIINPDDKPEDMPNSYARLLLGYVSRNPQSKSKLILTSHHLKNEFRDFTVRL